MSNEPLVTAMCVNWNGRPFLEKFITTLLESNYKNLEIMILDCASKDDSVSFIKKNYPSVKVIEFKKDPGVDYAYNFGLKIASGKYVMLLNNDIYLPKDTISKMVNALAEN
ncbi:MAG: glycosyltransferase, partial [Candidatus Methanoperedens sp.]